MSIAPGRIMGKPSVKALRKRFSGRVADYPPGGSRAAASKARSITILSWPRGCRGGGLIAGNLQPSFAQAVNQVLDHFGLEPLCVILSRRAGKIGTERQQFPQRILGVLVLAELPNAAAFIACVRK
jgi:hypothetical protein